MNNQTAIEPVNLKGSLSKTTVIENASLDEVENGVRKAIESQGFKIRKNLRLEKTIDIEALRGLKTLSALTLLMPYIGSHLPWGKRFLLKAKIS